jgi:hypothetical protein
VETLISRVIRVPAASTAHDDQDVATVDRMPTSDERIADLVDGERQIAFVDYQFRQFIGTLIPSTSGVQPGRVIIDGALLLLPQSGLAAATPLPQQLC